jgi:hypothetical protein
MEFAVYGATLALDLVVPDRLLLVGKGEWDNQHLDTA